MRELFGPMLGTLEPSSRLWFHAELAAPFGLAIPEGDLLVNTPEQPVGYADGHVIARPRSDIAQRTLINTGGIGYYWY